MPVEGIGDVVARGIEDGKGPVAAGQWLEPELKSVVVAIMKALNAQCVLVDGYHLFVHDDVACGFAHRT